MKIEKRDAFLLGIAAYAILITAVFIARPGGDEFGGTSNLYVNVATVSITLAAGLFALRYFGMRTSQGKSVLALTAACALWLVADVMWILNDNALVSIVDPLYLTGYALVLTGVFFGIKTLNPNFAKERKKIALVAAISVIASAAYFWLVPVAWDPEITALENALVAGYVVADIVILIPTLFLISQVLSGSFSRPWMLIAAANVINVCADITYNLNYDTYASGDMLDLLWYFAYLLYAAAFVMLRYDTEKMKTRAVQAAMAAAAPAKGKPAAEKPAPGKKNAKKR